jgi:adenylosuccinate lyase
MQALNLACACYAHTSARIGEAQDGYSHGVVSFVNPLAAKLGVSIGMSVHTACTTVINAKIHLIS